MTCVSYIAFQWKVNDEIICILFVSCIIIHKDGVSIFQLSNVAWKRKCIKLKYNSQSTMRCKVHVHLFIQVLVVNMFIMFIMSFYSFLNHLHQAFHKNIFLLWNCLVCQINVWQQWWNFYGCVIHKTHQSCHKRHIWILWIQLWDSCNMIICSFESKQAPTCVVLLGGSLLDRCLLIGSDLFMS